MFYRFLIAGFLSTFLAVLSAHAQLDPIRIPFPSLIPAITGPSDIAVGRTIVLDASTSVGIDEDTEYRWYREGVAQPISRSIEAVYTPEEAETTVIRLVVSSVINGEKVEAETDHTITVFDRKIVLIADLTVPKEKIEVHEREAENNGVYLRVIQPVESPIPLGDEDVLTDAIADDSNALAGAETILIWSDGISGLQAMLRAVEADEDRLNELKKQTIILITDRGLQTLARSVRGPFAVLQPVQIVLTHKEAINPLITADDLDNYLMRLEQWDLDHLIVDKSSVAIRPWNLVASLVNYMLTHGVATQTVILLLMLPIIATILAFLKQVIGITTFGLYTPSVIALSFLALGWPIGISFLLFIVITGYATRALMKRWRLLYIPKVAIILTVVSFTLLGLLGLGAYFGLTLSGDTIFVLLIMSTLSESFLTVKTEQGWYSAVLGIGETILAALLCVFIVKWSVLQSLVLAYPELILLTLVINAFLGRWTGLRLVEYFRFREVFKHLQEE